MPTSYVIKLLAGNLRLQARMLLHSGAMADLLITAMMLLLMVNIAVALLSTTFMILLMQGSSVVTLCVTLIVTLLLQKSAVAVLLITVMLMVMLVQNSMVDITLIVCFVTQGSRTAHAQAVPLCIQFGPPAALRAEAECDEQAIKESVLGSSDAMSRQHSLVCQENV